VTLTKYIPKNYIANCHYIVRSAIDANMSSIIITASSAIMNGTCPLQLALSLSTTTFGGAAGVLLGEYVGQWIASGVNIIPQAIYAKYHPKQEQEVELLELSSNDKVEDPASLLLVIGNDDMKPDQVEITIHDDELENPFIQKTRELAPNSSSFFYSGYSRMKEKLRDIFAPEPVLISDIENQL
jgi:predicted ferric reductase